jgi:hypothetical protein
MGIGAMAPGGKQETFEVCLEKRLYVAIGLRPRPPAER